MTAIRKSKYETTARPFTRSDSEYGFWKNGLSYVNEDVADRMVWKYGRRSDLNCSILFLYPTGESEPVGGVGLCQRDWYAYGQAQSTVLVSDLVIDHSHRSLGPALTLCEKAFGLAESEEFSFVYGWPNPISSILKKRLQFDLDLSLTRYSRSLDWHTVIESRVPFMAKPLSFLLGKIVGVRDEILGIGLTSGWQVSEFSTAKQTFGPEFDQLWRNCRDEWGMLEVRDDQFLNWRFGAGSLAQTSEVFTLENSKSGNLGGYVVWHEDESGDIVIRDLLYTQECGAKRLILPFIKAMKTLGKKRIFFTFHGSSQLQEDLGKLLFFRREEEKLMIKCNQHLSLGKFNKDNFYCTKADNDI